MVGLLHVHTYVPTYVNRIYYVCCTCVYSHCIAETNRGLVVLCVLEEVHWSGCTVCVGGGPLVRLYCVCWRRSTGQVVLCVLEEVHWSGCTVCVGGGPLVRLYCVCWRRFTGQVVRHEFVIKCALPTLDEFSLVLPLLVHDQLYPAWR